MSTTVAVVADDLTGAADTGGGFAAAGLSTIVSWPSAVLNGTLWDDYDVLSVDMETRIGDSARARDTTLRIVRSMRDRGVRAIYKKCDSMLRGHVGEEVSAARAVWHTSSIAIAALAFPHAGRTTIAGRQHVRGIPLDRPSIASILDDAGLVTRHADLGAVRRSAFDAWLWRCVQDRVEAVVCDAEIDADLDAIARAGAALGPRVVWVGSGDLARVLPSALKLGPSGRAHADRQRFARGPILFVAGSTSAIARTQAARSIAAGAVHVAVPLDSLVCRGGREERRTRVTQDIERHLRAARDVVVTIGELADVEVKEQAMAEQLGELLKPGASMAGGMVLTGGDTATGVLRALNTTALRLVDEVEPGVPIAITVAARTIPVVTKAGAFGDSETFVRAAARLRETFV